MTTFLIAATVCATLLVPYEKELGRNGAGHAISQYLKPDSQEFVPGRGFVLKYSAPRDRDELQWTLDNKDGGGLKLQCLG